MESTFRSSLHSKIINMDGVRFKYFSIERDNLLSNSQFYPSIKLLNLSNNQIAVFQRNSISTISQLVLCTIYLIQPIIHSPYLTTITCHTLKLLTTKLGKYLLSMIIPFKKLTNCKLINLYSKASLETRSTHQI